MEEQKVASHRRRLEDARAEAERHLRRDPAPGTATADDATDPARNDGPEERAIRGREKGRDPRDLRQARAGLCAARAIPASNSRPTTPTGTARPTARSRARTPTTRSASPTPSCKAVENDADWELIRRTDGKVAKTVKARDLWEQIGHAAWACADPGIQYHDTVNAWHTCPEDGAIRGSQPVFGVHVPRRHRLQPCVDEPADLLQGRRVPGRRLHARHAALDADAGNQRDDGAVPVEGNCAAVATTSARWAWAMPTSAVS